MKQIAPIEENRDMFFHDSGVNGAITGALIEVENTPTADVVEIVRCKDCKHQRERNQHEKEYLIEGVLICIHPEVSEDCWAAVFPTHFCSYGERKNDATD